MEITTTSSQEITSRSGKLQGFLLRSNVENKKAARGEKKNTKHPTLLLLSIKHCLLLTLKHSKEALS